jgi:hypothetical protein
MQKPLAEMSFTELQAELVAATAQRQAAEYQEGLAAWNDAVTAAQRRLAEVNAAIDAKLAACGSAGG